MNIIARLAALTADNDIYARRAYELRRLIDTYRSQAAQARQFAEGYNDEHSRADRDRWLRYADWCDRQADARE